MSLGEFYRTSGTTHQGIKEGDVVIIHDNSPHTTWKMAVVKDLVIGRDGLVRAATLCTANGTANGTANRPVTKLYH